MLYKVLRKSRFSYPMFPYFCRNLCRSTLRCSVGFIVLIFFYIEKEYRNFGSFFVSHFQNSSQETLSCFSKSVLNLEKIVSNYGKRKFSEKSETNFCHFVQSNSCEAYEASVIELTYPKFFHSIKNCFFPRF